jgi:hypothetical protein
MEVQHDHIDQKHRGYDQEDKLREYHGPQSVKWNLQCYPLKIKVIFEKRINRLLKKEISKCPQNEKGAKGDLGLHSFLG